MGGGIAMNFANAGIPVTIVEVKQDALDRGLAGDPQELRAHGLARPHHRRRGREAHGLITGSLDMEDLADATW
jgi:3-hydroxyacyl-CoA dehydrogenase